MPGTTAFPAALDTTLVPDDVDGSTATLAVVTVEVPTHSDLHNNQSAAIRALQAKVGIDASLDVASVDYKLARLQAIVDSLLAANVAVVGPSSQYLFVGEAVTGLTFDVIGGSEPFSVDLIGEPAGVTASISTRTVTIGGTPTTVSAPSVRVVATDDNGRAGEIECVMDVLAQLSLTGDFTGSVPFVGTTWAPTTYIGSSLALSGGNLTVTRTSGTSQRSVRSLKAMTGPTYFEIQFNHPSGGSTDNGYGVCDATFSDWNGPNYPGSYAGTSAVYIPGNRVYANNGTPGSVDFTDSASGTPLVGMVAFNPSTGKIWYGIVGVGWFGGGNPAAGTSPTHTLTGGTGPYYAVANLYSSTGPALTANFGSSAFAGTVPAGFAPGISA